MKAIAVVSILALAGLASCGPSKHQETAACELDAYRTYSNGPDFSSDFDSRDAMLSHYVSTCMSAKGYRFLDKKAECQFLPNFGLMVMTNPACYEQYRLDF